MAIDPGQKVLHWFALQYVPFVDTARILVVFDDLLMVLRLTFQRIAP